MDLVFFLVAAVVLIFTIIKVIRLRKGLSIEDFYQNDRLLATYLVWTFINLFLFFSSTGLYNKRFYPFHYAQTGLDCYDAQELLVYAGGPLVLVYIFQLFKRNRVGGEN